MFPKAQSLNVVVVEQMPQPLKYDINSNVLSDYTASLLFSLPLFIFLTTKNV